MLSVRNLDVAYGPVQALRNVALDVGAGECVAVIGANGAGKSTLLNALSGLARAKGGRIEFDGKDITGSPAWKVARGGLLQVPEGRQILGALTVEENLQLGALAAQGREVRSRKEQVFELFPVLAQRRTEPGGALSGGQQQMLAIGRALMGAPRLLMLDEPSLGLAPKVVADVFAALGALNRDGLALLLVEQNARMALSASRRAYVLERGAVIAQGASGELARDPRVIEHYLGISSQTA